MDVPQWERMKEILLAAKNLPAEERDAFLDRACAGDTELRRALDDLLAADTEKVAFLDRPLLNLLGGGDDPDLAGREIGAYRVLRELGRGGMAVVYLAARVDKEFERLVAIKVLSTPERDDRELEALLRSEIQILAQLSHPNIATLYETGRTGEGRLCLIMEYVQGESVDRYCRSRQLSLEERLRLFRQVCAAVAYAHRNLIVHHDLKPSNILVSAEGVPKLLDFGIAKLLPPAGPEPPPSTVRPLRFFTPEYASPEQVCGGAITTASDVYSLGVLLYELLTGHRPYRLEEGTPEELERVVCREEPPWPSVLLARLGGERTETRRLRRRLQGDLDRIAAMALAKEPGDRYASVEQLSEDVERHLAAVPVRARPSSWAYRTGRFLRRHRLAASMTAALVLLGLGFAVAMTLQWRQTVRERDKLKQVSNLLVDLFEIADPSRNRGRTLPSVEILREGTRRIRFQLESQPAVQADLLDVLGHIYLRLGLLDEAREPFEVALAKRRQLYGERHPEFASGLNSLGELALEKGDFKAAESYFRQALALRRGLLRPPNEETVESLNNLAWVLVYKGDRSAAEALLRQALRIEEHLSSPPEPAVYNTLAFVYKDQGKYPQAELYFRRALELRRQQLGSDHPRVATGMKNLASVLAEEGKYREAKDLYRETLALQRRLLGDRHSEVAGTLGDLGFLLYDQGELASAERYLREAISIRRLTTGGALHAELGTNLSNLGKVLRKEGKLGESEAATREAIGILRAALGNGHSYVAYALSDLGGVLVEQQRFGEAERSYLEALDIAQKSPDGKMDPSVGLLFQNYALCLAAQGDFAQAERQMRQALETFRRNLPAGHRWTAEAESRLGGFLGELDRTAEAEGLLASGYGRLQVTLGAASPRTQAALERLIHFYLRSGNSRQVERYRALLGAAR
jgi:serine/threonine-protein kinase